jgi:hypothetical protein
MLLARLAAATVAVVASLPAVSQEWGFRTGAASRVEYTDNYQLRAFDQIGATTVTVAPFVTGYRRTESSQIDLLAGVGYNYVLASEGENTDYWSGRLGLSGSSVQERHTYGFNVGVVRDQTIRTETFQTGVLIGPGSTRTSSTAGLTYDYQVDERWTAGVSGNVFASSFDDVQEGSAVQDNDGWSVGGNLGYALSDRTRLTLSTTYAMFFSDITDSSSVSATLGVAHRYSERLSFSAYGGYFWSSIESTQNLFVCPTTPIFCQTGLVAPVQVAFGTEVTASGPLFGGSLDYRIAERTAVNVNGSQNIQPSGVGTITEVTSAAASLTHSFSDRVRGELLGAWRRSTIPGADDGSTGLRSDFSSFGASLSYDLTREWLVTVGARRDWSDQRGLTADANVVYVSVAWNWPGQSIGDWGGFVGGFGGGTASSPSATPGTGSPSQSAPGRPMFDPTPAPAGRPAGGETTNP